MSAKTAKKIAFKKRRQQSPVFKTENFKMEETSLCHGGAKEKM
jgi:hypothetical protein